MPTSTERLDSTTNAGFYRAGNVLHRQAISRPSVRVENNYRLQVASHPIGASYADEFWLIGTHSAERGADRTSDLRRQVLSYQMECPHDSSVAKAVNDALKFINLVPATAALPYVALAADGEVNFYWRRGQSLLIDVGFFGDGMMHYYVWDEASGVDVDDSILFSGRSLPRCIVNSVPQLRG